MFPSYPFSLADRLRAFKTAPTVGVSPPILGQRGGLCGDAGLNESGNIRLSRAEQRSPHKVLNF